MDEDNLLSLDDLKDVFAQLEEIDEPEFEPDAEELASKKRYDEIIKKNSNL